MSSQTPPPVTLNRDLLGLGRKGLHALRAALSRDGSDAAAAAFQEAGFAAGDQVYDLFRRWARTWTSVDDPGQLDAATLGECLGQFFDGLGWGAVTVTPVGKAGLMLESPDWAEADPDHPSAQPTCFFSAGMLSGVLGHLADRDVAVMEVECRSRGDQLCRFVAGSPEALTKAFEAMSTGGDWAAALA